MEYSPITSWQIDGEKMATVIDFIFWAPNSLQMVTAAMKLKDESDKIGLKFIIQKTKIMASGPITSWEIDGETAEKVSDFIFFFVVQNHCRW